MSCLNLRIKRLLPAKKAWKSFTITFQKKLHKIKKSKAINTTTKRLHNTIVGSVLGRSPSLSPRLRLKKRRLPSKTLCSLYIRRHSQQRYAPVYIDQLFVDATVNLQAKTVENQKAMKEITTAAETQFKEVEMKEMKMRLEQVGNKEEAEIGGKKANCDFSGPCTSSSASLELRGVDERAEKFIAKFREEMRLEREESYGEFQEMLARGL